MPQAPKHPCAEPRCPVLLSPGVSRCPAHARPAWHPSQRIARMRGRQLQAERMRLFAEHPMCELCGIRVATIRDHIVNLAAGGQDIRENTQSLCSVCHDEKTRRESVEGRLR